MVNDDESQGPPRTAEHWNARYKSDQTPWDTGRVNPHLRQLVEDGLWTPGRLLEVGCGTGVDAAWLAGQGFEVTGVDLSEIAIARARARVEEHGVDVDLRTGSFPNDAPPFDFAFDFGCFHVVGTSEERDAFVDDIARNLKPAGQWLSILGSTEGPTRDHGPPRRSARDIVAAVEPRLEIVSLTDAMYDANLSSPARAWVLLARRRA